MAHICHTHEDKHLRQLWAKCTFQHPREQAGALLASFYENTQDVYIAEEGQGTCDVCGVPYACGIQHMHLQCPRLWANVATGLAMIAHTIREHVRTGVTMQQVWGGLQVHGRGTTVLLVWMPPRHSHWWVQNMHRQGITLWPLHPASVPSRMW